MPLKIPDNYRLPLNEFVCDSCENDFYMADEIDAVRCPYEYCTGNAWNNGNFTAYIRYPNDTKNPHASQ